MSANVSVSSALNNRLITFVDIDNEYNCAICMQIADEPVRCSGLCAGVFCNGCMTLALARSRSCPVCSKSNITASRDVVLKNQILKHQIYCPNKGADADNTTTSARERKRKASPDEQCTWTGRYDELGTHLIVCDLEKVTCRNDGCEVKIERQELEAHEEACIHRNVKCDHCNVMVKAAAMTNHRAICPEMMITCMCGSQCLRKRQRAHRDNDCLMTRVKCEIVGCGAKMRRIDYEKHQAESAQDHVRLLSSVVQRQSAELERQSAEVEKQSAELEKQSAELEKQSANVLSLSKRSESHSVQVKWSIIDIVAKVIETAAVARRYSSLKLDALFHGNHKLGILAEIQGYQLGLFLYKDDAMSDDKGRLNIGGTSFTVTKTGLRDVKNSFAANTFLEAPNWGKGYSSFLADMTPYIDNDGINVTVNIKLSKVDEPMIL